MKIFMRRLAYAATLAGRVCAGPVGGERWSWWETHVTSRIGPALAWQLASVRYPTAAEDAAHRAAIGRMLDGLERAGGEAPRAH